MLSLLFDFAQSFLTVGVPLISGRGGEFVPQGQIEHHQVR
jgi:hypothetical protein